MARSVGRTTDERAVNPARRRRNRPDRDRSLGRSGWSAPASRKSIRVVVRATRCEPGRLALRELLLRLGNTPLEGFHGEDYMVAFREALWL